MWHFEANPLDQLDFSSTPNPISPPVNGLKHQSNTDDKNTENHSSNLVDISQENSAKKPELGNVWENPLQSLIYNEPSQEVEDFPNNLTDSPQENLNCNPFGNIQNTQRNPIPSDSAVNNSKEMNNPPTHILDMPPPIDNPFDNPLGESNLPLDNPTARLKGNSLLDNSNQRILPTPNQTHMNFNPTVDSFNTSSNHMASHTITNPINTNVNPLYFPDPPPPYHFPPAPMFRLVFLVPYLFLKILLKACLLKESTKGEAEKQWGKNGG